MLEQQVDQKLPVEQQQQQQPAVVPETTTTVSTSAKSVEFKDEPEKLPTIPEEEPKKLNAASPLKAVIAKVKLLLACVNLGKREKPVKTEEKKVEEAAAEDKEDKEEKPVEETKPVESAAPTLPPVTTAPAAAPAAPAAPAPAEP